MAQYEEHQMVQTTSDPHGGGRWTLAQIRRIESFPEGVVQVTLLAQGLMWTTRIENIKPLEGEGE